jgi:hypothetical protein
VDFEKIAQAYRKSPRQPVGGKTSNKKEAKPPTSRRKNLQHYRGTTEITSKITSTTTTKTTAQNAARKEAPVRLPHRKSEDDEHHLSFEERKQLLLAQAEELQQAEKKAGRERDNDLSPIGAVVDLLTKAGSQRNC